MAAGAAGEAGSVHRPRAAVLTVTSTVPVPAGLRLAAEGQPHAELAVSLNAHQWASDRLQGPLRREIVIVLTGGLLGFAIVFAVLLILHRSVGLLVVALRRDRRYVRMDYVTTPAGRAGRRVDRTPFGGR
jgi:hypothetical protein